MIVFRGDGSDVLLQSTESGFVFPSLEIPRWQRRAETLTMGLQRDWGCDAVCLFSAGDPVTADSPNGIHYEVMECWHDRRRDDGKRWKPIASLAAESFQDEGEFRTLERALRESELYERDPLSPFAKKGWFRELRTWVAGIVRSHRIELTGPSSQYNAGPSFSLIRFETSGPAVWFKAVGEPNQREFPLTLQLVHLFPRYLPELVATRPEWNGWISLEVNGMNLADTGEIALWEKAAAALATLQIASVRKIRSILGAGAHDLRVERLSAQLHPFLSVVTQLMQQQTKVPPQVLSPEQLDLLEERIGDALAWLEELEIPEVLGHTDLNPGNIVVSSDRCVFIDWAEAHVGHPFFSLEYLLEHFRRVGGRNPALESRFTKAYMAPWRQLFSDEVLSDAVTLAPLAAVFAYAVASGAWRDPVRLKDHGVAGYLRSLARRMHREAIQLVQRRPACLS